MRSHSELYVHLVWATWNRAAVLERDVRPAVYRCISEQAERLGANTLAIGGIEDHVHVLARFPARLSISDLAKHLKGASSRFASADLGLRNGAAPFRWQGSYGAFSVSRRGLAPVQDYIANQERHHREDSLIHLLEITAARGEPA